MKILMIFVLLMAFSMSIQGEPLQQFSPDGSYFRIYNPDRNPYYCIIALGNDYPFEKIVYPGQFTRWYPAQYGYTWDCQ